MAESRFNGKSRREKIKPDEVINSSRASAWGFCPQKRKQATLDTDIAWQGSKVNILQWKTII